MSRKDTDRAQVLGQEMSDISERCWAAGWLGGTEYLLPELCVRADRENMAQPWGRGEVTPGKARGLLELARRLGHWANLDEQGNGYEPFDPWPIPLQYIEILDGELHGRE
jgi:hypothetical protein